MLPAGHYALTAKGSLQDVDRASFTCCFLSGPSGDLDRIDVSTQDDGAGFDAAFALAATVALPSGGNITLTCQTGVAGVFADSGEIVAVHVTNLH